MRFLYYIGFMLLILAFASAAADVIPRNFARNGGGSFVSAYDLLYAIWPGKLVVAQIYVERLSFVLWDPFLTSLLAFPAWLLLGLPGGLLAWLNRPFKELSPEIIESMRQQEESLQLYDKLTQDARDAGFDDEEYDQSPSLEGHDSIDFSNVNSDPDFTAMPLEPEANATDWKSGEDR